MGKTGSSKRWRGLREIFREIRHGRRIRNRGDGIRVILPENGAEACANAEAPQIEQRVSRAEKSRRGVMALNSRSAVGEASYRRMVRRKISRPRQTRRMYLAKRKPAWCGMLQCSPSAG